jgi:hypothetical protein
MVMVRLTRKLAERLDGVDLSSRSVGDVFEMAPREARLLIEEGWAVPYERGTPAFDTGSRRFRALSSNPE